MLSMKVVDCLLQVHLSHFLVSLELQLRRNQKKSVFIFLSIKFFCSIYFLFFRSPEQELRPEL